MDVGNHWHRGRRERNPIVEQVEEVGALPTHGIQQSSALGQAVPRRAVSGLDVNVQAFLGADTVDRIRKLPREAADSVSASDLPIQHDFHWPTRCQSAFWQHLISVFYISESSIAPIPVCPSNGISLGSLRRSQPSPAPFQ